MILGSPRVLENMGFWSCHGVSIVRALILDLAIKIGWLLSILDTRGNGLDRHFTINLACIGWDNELAI